MRKLIVILLAFLFPIPGFAIIKYKDGSLKAFTEKNKAIGGDNLLGITDMTAANIEWPTDVDGNDNTSALLIVDFEMLSPEDISNLTPSTNGGGSTIVKKEVKPIGGRTKLLIYLLAGDNIRVTLSNNQLGNATLPAINYEPQQIYEATVYNEGDITVSIQSIPSNAYVIWDGAEVGRTPLTLPQVKIGPHSIALNPDSANIAICVPQKTQTIHISESNAALSYNLYKKKDIVVVTNPKSASVEVAQNGRTLTSGTGTVELKDAIYGSKYDITTRAGSEQAVTQLYIDHETPEVYYINVIGTRVVTFKTTYESKEVDAEISLNDKTLGKSPFTIRLEPGKYNVMALYHGHRSINKLIEVNKGSKDLVEIPILSSKYNWVFDPFEVDYQKRTWGINASYVHRAYKFKKNGKPINFNPNGEDISANGFQVGVTWQPYFKYGQGFCTGLYYQGLKASTDLVGKPVDSYESSFYIPMQYQFRLPLRPHLSIAFNAGAAMTYVIANSIKPRKTSAFDYEGSENAIDNIMFPNDLDFSLLFGAALQYKLMQFELKYAAGLTNHKLYEASTTIEKISCKNSQVSIGMSLLFDTSSFDDYTESKSYRKHNRSSSGRDGGDGWNPFKTEYDNRTWGFVFNYVQRYYKYREDGRDQKYNWKGEKGIAYGIQFGYTWQPYFGKGQGLNTGVYLQTISSDTEEDYRADLVDINDVALFVPLQYQFRLPLHRNFSIAVNAGAAITCGLFNGLIDMEEGDSEDLGYGEISGNGLCFPDRLDYSLLLGVALKYKAFQLEVKYAPGLKKHKLMYGETGSERISCKSSMLSVGFSLLFR